MSRKRGARELHNLQFGVNYDKHVDARGCSSFK